MALLNNIFTGYNAIPSFDVKLTTVLAWVFCIYCLCKIRYVHRTKSNRTKGSTRTLTRIIWSLALAVNFREIYYQWICCAFSTILFRSIIIRESPILFKLPVQPKRVPGQQRGARINDLHYNFLEFEWFKYRIIVFSGGPE